MKTQFMRKEEEAEEEEERERRGAGGAQEKQEPHTKDVGNKNPTQRMWGTKDVGKKQRFLIIVKTGVC